MSLSRNFINYSRSVTIYNGELITLNRQDDLSWDDPDGTLENLYENNYYSIMVNSDYRLLIPSVKKDGNNKE